MKAITPILGLAACLATHSAFAVSSGTANVDEIDGTVQFFNDNERRFAPTAIATPTQQNALVVADGNVYVTFYNTDGSLMVARRDDDNNSDSWTRVEFPSSFDQTDPNAHRTTNIAVSPNDKRIHVMWGHHGGKLRYTLTNNSNATTKSDSQFKADLFSGRRDYLKSGQTLNRVTYPRMFVGKNNKLQVVWRDDGGSGNANNYISTYNDNKGWSSRLKIINGQTGTYQGQDDRCAYLNDVGYRNGRTHISWTWRETPGKVNGNITNHDLMYAYSTDNGNRWYNRFNNQIASTSNWTINLNTRDIRFRTLGYSKRIDNQCGQAIDRAGRVHMVWRHEDANGNKVLHHYFKSAGSTNVNARVRSNLASQIRPKIYADPSGNSKDTVYVLGIAGNKVVVYGANKGSNNWGSWSTLYTSSADYISASAVMASNGRKMFILAQRRPSNTQTANSSRLDLISLPVTP